MQSHWAHTKGGHHNYPKISILFSTDSGFLKMPNINFPILIFLLWPAQNSFKTGFID